MATTWIEDLAEEARQRVGAKDRQPTEHDLLRLAEEMGAKLIHAPVPSPYCTRTERGSVIVLPLSWNGPEEDEDLCHEAAHLLLSPGGGSLIRFLWPNCPRRARLAALWDRRDEQYAERFVAAWFRR